MLPKKTDEYAIYFSSRIDDNLYIYHISSKYTCVGCALAVGTEESRGRENISRYLGRNISRKRSPVDYRRITLRNDKRTVLLRYIRQCTL